MGYYNRIKYLKKILTKARGNDPQDHLDEETIAEYQKQIERLEYLADEINDAKRKCED